MAPKQPRHKAGLCLPHILSIFGDVAHAFMFSLLTRLRPKMLKQHLSKITPRDARGAEGALPSWCNGFLIFTGISTQPVGFSCCILCVMALVFTCVIACPAFIWQVPQCQSRWTRGPPVSVTSFAPFLALVSACEYDGLGTNAVDRPSFLRTP